MTDDMAKALDEITKTGNPPDTLVTSLENIEEMNPALAERLRVAGPDVPVPTSLVTDGDFDLPTCGVNMPEPEPEDEGPVRRITLRGNRPRPTTQLISTVQSLRPKNLWYYVDQLAMDTTMQISREDMPPIPKGMTVKTATFIFHEHPMLHPGTMYLFKFMEAGRCRIFQKIGVEKDGRIGWIKTVTARPGAKSNFVWVEIHEESGKLVSKSSRLLFGRE